MSLYPSVRKPLAIDSMDETHLANYAYATACSLAQMAKTIPYADRYRAAQLAQHANVMLQPFGAQLMSHDADGIAVAIDALMPYVPATIPRPR